MTFICLSPSLACVGGKGPKPLKPTPDKTGGGRPFVPAEKRLLTNVPKDPKAFLVWAFDAPSSVLNVEVVDALGRLPEAWAEELLTKGLERDEDGEFEDLEVAAAVAFSRARAGATDLVPLLREILDQSDEDWDVDPFAARALGAIPGENALNLLVAMAGREDPDEDVMRVVIPALAGKGGDTARDAIKGLLDSDETDIQCAAAAALLGFGDADAKRLMDLYFDDPDESDWDDEDVVAEVLGIEGSEAALAYLVRLATHESWTTRQIVARSLGRTRLPEAQKVLRDMLADEDEDVRVCAAAALVRGFGDETGVALLPGAVRAAKDREIALTALKALLTLNRPEDRALYQEIMDQPVEKVPQLLFRVWAAYGLLRK